MVAAHLERLGYSILARNYTCRGGEIDLVAEEAGVLCFVEVRSRRSDRYGDPAETITLEKRRRIARAASRYLLAHGGETRPCRFDVVTLLAGGEPRLLRDAFTVE